MTDTIIKLNAQARETDKNPRQLRANGFIPATVYGKGMESVSIQLDAHDFELSTRGNLEATFEVAIEGKTYNVVIQDVQKNYSVNQVLNVEFKTV